MIASWSVPAAELCDIIECESNIWITAVVGAGVAAIMIFIAWWGRKPR